MSLDEALTGSDFIPHQHIEGAIRLRRILHRHLQDGAVFGIHCRLPELLGVHLAQALVALNLEFRVLAFLAPLLQRLVVIDVFFVLAVFDFVERRLCDVKMPVLDQRLHVAEEEGEEQCADVGPIYIRVRS